MQYWILPLRGADLHRVSSVSDIVLRTRLHLEFNSGGERGIRTPETLAGLPELQSGALDQLCDLSTYNFTDEIDL